jgi:hypothetical protein
MTQAMMPQRVERPIRAGVFSTVAAADEAVRLLLAAGFSKGQITVVCSDETKERHFREFEHQQPAGANTPAAAAIGGTVGASLGGIAAGAAGIATGGLPLIVAAGIGIWAGAVLGGFLGAMSTRGLEKEAANFYDQAVSEGKLLVTVEEHQSAIEPSLATAEQVFAEAGAEPLPLTEG